MSFKKIVKDIKDLKIQGAENVGLAGAKALIYVLKEAKTTDVKRLLTILNKAKQILFKARATEPFLRNVVSYCLKNLKGKGTGDIARELIARVEYVNKYVKNSQKKIIQEGARKIKNGSIVYTHCHSSTVVRILIEAKRQKKKFEVYCTETRPRFQGRMTAKDLVKHGIKTTLFVDGAMRLAIKETDLCLIGCDSITESRLINKIGSELICEICDRFDVPVYVCTNAWKFNTLSLLGFDEEVELRSHKEVWDKKPAGLRIKNYAFEKIHPELVTGIISEMGVYPHQMFMQEFKKKYKKLF
jgi:ribose 1,5-bisphosphate isomerase